LQRENTLPKNQKIPRTTTATKRLGSMIRKLWYQPVSLSMTNKDEDSMFSIEGSPFSKTSLAVLKKDYLGRMWKKCLGICTFQTGLQKQRGLKLKELHLKELQEIKFNEFEQSLRIRKGRKGSPQTRDLEPDS